MDQLQVRRSGLAGEIASRLPGVDDPATIADQLLPVLRKHQAALEADLGRGQLLPTDGPVAGYRDALAAAINASDSVVACEPDDRSAFAVGIGYAGILEAVR